MLDVGSICVNAICPPGLTLLKGFNSNVCGDWHAATVSVAPLHRMRRVTSGGMVIRGAEIVSRGGPKGRVEKFRQTWWCLVLTQAVVQEVFDLNPVGLE